MEESIANYWPLLPPNHPFSSFPNLKARLRLRNRFGIGVFIYLIAVVIMLVISMFYGYENQRFFALTVIFPVGLLAFAAPIALILLCMRLEEVYKPRIKNLTAALHTTFEQVLTSSRSELATLAEQRLQQLVSDIHWYEQHEDSMHPCCEYLRKEFRWSYKVYVHDNALLSNVGYTYYFKI